MKLFAARYNDTDYSGTNPVEVFQDVQDLGIRWNILEGGIQRIELTVPAKSDLDAFDRYRYHLGQLIAIYDSYIDRVITGNIYEIIPKGRSVTYICAGPYKRLWFDWYSIVEFEGIAGSDDTDVTIKDILTDSVTIVSSDQSNIDGSGVNTGSWYPQRENGSSKYPGEAIQELAAVGDSSGNVMDFYLVDQPLGSILQLQKPLAYFKSRSSSATIDWQFDIEDIASDGLTIGRNIWNLKRNIYLAHGRISGIHDGGTSAHLIDADGNFEANTVRLGDTVVNLTTQKVESVEAFVDAVNDDELDLTNSPLGTEWHNNDRYAIQLREPRWYTVENSGETDLWGAYFAEPHPEMDVTMTDNYAVVLKNVYEKPILQQSFVLTSPIIRDTYKARWPLWRPLMGDSFYFRINNLFPETATLVDSDDREKTFQAVAMDYTYRDNRLRIVPATADSRLDVLLQKALLKQRRINDIISTAS